MNRNDAEDRSLAWEEIRREHLIHDQWIDFRRSAYRYPDGRVFEPFYTYSKKDYSVVVARTEEGKYLCVRQFRQGLREVTTEFPAGGIEHGEGERPGPAEALAAAKRELQEETGSPFPPMRPSAIITPIFSWRRTAVRSPGSSWTKRRF